MKRYIMMIFNYFINNPFFILLLFSLISILSLSIAYIAQYVFGIIPCKLCMYSRIPYIIISILPIIFLIPGLKNHIYIGLIIIALAILSGIILSIYHIGIENYWFAPSLCKFNLDQETKYNGAVYDFLLGDEASLSSCENPTFKLFGIFTFPSLNLIFSSILFLLINYFLFQKFFYKLFFK